MLFNYTKNDISYVVSAEVSDIPEDGDIEIHFLARVNGGRGRMPRDRVVDVGDLQVLVDFETAKKLFKLQEE